jgi:hypothetical protein
MGLGRGWFCTSMTHRIQASHPQETIHQHKETQFMHLLAKAPSNPQLRRKRKTQGGWTKPRHKKLLSHCTELVTPTLSN